MSYGTGCWHPPNSLHRCHGHACSMQGTHAWRRHQDQLQCRGEQLHSLAFHQCCWLKNWRDTLKLALRASTKRQINIFVLIHLTTLWGHFNHFGEFQPFGAISLISTSRCWNCWNCWNFQQVTRKYFNLSGFVIRVISTISTISTCFGWDKNDP